MFHPDKFGYYESNGRTTYSKYEAIEWGNAQWNFNDDVYSAIDWTIEPEIDLWSMYIERAKQIREQYDYCVIWYSGGSDSHNLLQAWMAAGLKVDEIASFWNYDTTGEYYNHQNAEITQVVLKDIEDLKKSGLEFKFRLVDVAPIGMQLFKKFGTNIEYYSNHFFQVSTFGKHFFREYINDYKELIDSGKKVCFIWGKEKPFLFYENDKFCFRFWDGIDDVVGPYVQQNYNKGWYDELFYWSPDFPLLPIKQAHIVKNFLKDCSNRDCFVFNHSTGPRTENNNKYFPDGRLAPRLLKKLLYPKWSNNIFNNGKSQSFLLGMRDQWFVDSKSSQLNTMQNAINNYKLLTKQESYNGSILPFYSKPYWLES